MKKHILLALIINCQLSIVTCNAQTLSPKVIPSTGGYFTGGGNSLSWTMGETVTQTFQNGYIVLTQGEQQPYITLRILNLKAFIEGYYMAGAGQMQPVLYNAGVSANQLICDSIVVELHDQFDPNILLASDHVVLNIDGTAYAHFPSALSGTSAYLSIRSRNGIETWSKLPITLGNNTSFDFTSP